MNSKNVIHIDPSAVWGDVIWCLALYRGIVMKNALHFVAVIRKYTRSKC